MRVRRLPQHERTSRFNVMRKLAAEIQVNQRSAPAALPRPAPARPHPAHGHAAFPLLCAQEQSRRFRQSQKKYMQDLHAQSDGDTFLDRNLGGRGTGTKAPLTISEGMDKGFLPEHMEALQALEEQSNERERCGKARARSQRSSHAHASRSEIIQVAKSVSELAQLFQELNMLVIEQVPCQPARLRRSRRAPPTAPPILLLVCRAPWWTESITMWRRRWVASRAQTSSCKRRAAAACGGEAPPGGSQRSHRPTSTSARPRPSCASSSCSSSS